MKPKAIATPKTRGKAIIILLLLLCMPAALPVAAQQACPEERIVPEQLPNMNVPRSGHSAFYANGELTVAGGHTTGFVPTNTAEYFNGKKWHAMTMIYSHDNGFVLNVGPGEVLIGGGHKEELGVGQTYTLERYDATTHSFEGFGCLDRRRVLANAALMAGGNAIISGNHYADDAIACYDGSGEVKQIKEVAQGRVNPYVLPIANDDAIIVGGANIYMNHHDTIWADRLKGDAFRVPLLEQWTPVFTDKPFSSSVCAIGNGKDDYAYLLMVVDKSGQVGIVTMRDTVFSLLPTDYTIPMSSLFGPIAYKAPVVVDKPRQRGYIIGVDSICRHQYVLAIDYGREPAALTLYYTDSLEHAVVATPVVTPKGDLILAGGNPENNYKPLSDVRLYRFATAGEGATEESASLMSGLPTWLYLLLIAAALAVATYLIIYIRRRKRRGANSTIITREQQLADEKMMQRLCEAIERDEQYLKSRLRLSDISVEMGVSVNTLAACIERQRHCTFAQLVAEYRVHYAQQMISKNPDMKLSAVIESSGFTSESTFFRSFKTVTGLSPKEWLAHH